MREVGEDMPWVRLAVDPLAGRRVPIEQDTVTELWREARLTDVLHREAERSEVGGEEDTLVRTGPRYPDDPDRLIEELIVLGVMRRRRDGRIDLPDVYRIAFNIGRKGRGAKGLGIGHGLALRQVRKQAKDAGMAQR
ncbi:hypothetical protein ACRAWF_45215 [Streptomyces sp. L7]